MKAIHIAHLALALILLAGCDSLQQEVDPSKIPTATAKLVVHSYISPQDTLLTVVVERPKAILGEQSGTSFNRQYLSDATVELSDGSRSVQLPFSYQDQLYVLRASNLPILAGRTYTLRVSAPNYPATTAQCTVPEAVVPTDIRVDSLIENQFGQPRTIIYGRLYWNDKAGQPNYYRVMGRLRQTLLNAPNNSGDRTSFTFESPLSFPEITFTTDKNRDGEDFFSPRGEQNLYYSPTNPVVSSLLTMTLNNIDAESYRYYDAMRRQSSAGDNPFAEPVQVPTNIQNGLGCFGAFNQATRTVRVK
ncbi:DUF4249 domain-containing protein [Fibrella aquatica]|uniref:DUF4249 domain-containing protein n=1 Tax=Fibrella aquatica TaxID=3242487 RepID=UPI003521EA59